MNIWTGLLFLEGVIADAPLARELSGDDTSPRDTATADVESRAIAPAIAAAH